MRVHDAQTGGHGWAGLTELQGCCGNNGGRWRGQAPCIWPDLWREGHHRSCGCHPEPWFRSGTATAGKEGCLHDPSMPRMNGSIQRFLEHRSESFDCRQRNDFCRQIMLRAFIPRSLQLLASKFCLAPCWRFDFQHGDSPWTLRGRRGRSTDDGLQLPPSRRLRAPLRRAAVGLVRLDCRSPAGLHRCEARPGGLVLPPRNGPRASRYATARARS